MANSTTEFNMNKAGVKSFTITPLNSFFKSPNQGGTMTGLSQQQPFVPTTQKPIIPSFFTPAQSKPIATSQSFGFGQTQQPTPIANPNPFGQAPQPTPIVNPNPFGFGQSQAPQPTPIVNPNPFGFGQSQAQQPTPIVNPNPFGFGQSQAPQPTPIVNPNPFGQAPQPQPTPTATPNPFGQAPQPTPTPIVNPNPFGFGQTQAPQPTPIVNPNPFGQAPQPTSTANPTPFSFNNAPRSIYPQTQFVPTNTDTILQQAYMPVLQSDVIYNKEELKNFLYTETYNKDSVAQKDNDIYIRLNSAILRFEMSDKLGEDTYKLKDKRHQIELAITFGTTKPYFSQHELNSLKIRPVGKKLFNKDKNRLENCYFIESYDGTLYKYLSELKRVEGRERSFGSLNTDIPRILHIVEQVRKQMISLYEMNNRYAYTDLQFDNIAYKYRTYEGNNVDDVEFRLLVDQLPYDSDNIYLSTYPPIDLKKGEMILSSNEDRLHAMSWQLGILLLSFVCRHTMQFNKLNWVVNNSFTQSDYTELLNIMKNSYGDKIVKYLHNVPSERPSIFEPLV